MVKELRLGNLILMNGEQTHVYQIEHRFKEAYRINDIIIDARIIGDRFEGIELTESWLIKFGFTLISVEDSPFSQPKMPYWCNDGFLLFFNEGESNKGQYMIGVGEQRFGVYSVVTRRWITEVHTLQNAFYTWTGRELELTK